MADWVVIDFETASACDIKKCGAEVYSEHSTTHIHCLAYAWPEGDVQLWTPGEALPADLVAHIAAGRIVVAHNLAFEAALWANVLTKRYGDWPSLAPEQCRDTMAMARALSMPGSLGDCATALRLDVSKDMDGHKVMMKLARPRKRDPLEFHTPQTAPEDFAKLYAYCKTDVDVERQLYLILPPLIEREQALFVLDQKINWRGVQLDTFSARRGIEVMDGEKSELSSKVSAITNGASTATQRDALLAWLKSEGVEIDGLTKADVARALADPKLEGTAAKAALQIRKEAAKSSTAKLSAMVAGACHDGRARGLFSYHGANTGRWAGRRLQPQNMSRPGKGFKPADAEAVMTYLRYSSAATCIRHEYGSVMEALSWSLRSFICAAPGHRLIAADYSNIEGRVLAWLAGEEWKVEAFREFDAGRGHDLYKLAYAKSFGVAVEQVDDDGQRQIGKVQELALGYSGGIGSFISMGANYGVVPEHIAAAVKAITPTELWNDTLKRLPAPGTRFRAGLEPEVWCGLRIVVDSWRAAHPHVVHFWRALEDAAIEAVEYPGQVINVPGGLVKYRKAGDFLQCRLPSGRCVTYPYAEMKRFPSMNWEAKRDELTFAIKEALTVDNALSRACAEDYKRELAEHERNIEWTASLTYWGVSSKAGSSKKWKQQRAYGGLLAENCLAGDTLVLSRRGWIRLDSVTRFDQLWDGVGFAFHDGLISKGFAKTLSVDGVRMTAEHLVHTVEGWRCASQSNGYCRQDVRLPYGYRVPRLKRSKIALAHALRMWDGEGSYRVRTKAGPCKILRMQASRIDRRRAESARYDETSGVCCVALNDRSLHTSNASSLAQLWRARHIRLRGMGASVRKLLVRHGANVSTWTYARPERQQRELLCGQLPLGADENSSPEQTRQSTYEHALGHNNRSGSFGTFGNWRHDAAIPDCEQLAGKPLTVTTGCEEQVFDILNCGPLNRFVVLGGTGPIIVHNCTQAVARDCLAEAIPRLEAAGYPVVMHVHDEIVSEVPNSKGDLKEFAHIMCAQNEWAAGLPVVAAGWEGERYRKA